MNNETEQPVEASTTGTTPSIASLRAKLEPNDILKELVESLHVAILVTISAILYLDTFSLIYVFRLFAQNNLTTSGFRLAFFSGLIGIVTHLFHDLTKPEGFYGQYNYGGLLVDFVGEKPSSRLKLVTLDLLVLGLQVLYLALHYKQISSTKETGASAPAQDLEAEEAGISRAQPAVPVENEEGIEMQSLLSAHADEGPATEARKLQPLDERIIVLTKEDFMRIFTATIHTTAPGSSDQRVASFWDRFERIRAARRAAQNAA